MDDHILDRPVWTSLNSVHAQYSVGSKSARKFECDIGPMAATRDDSPQSLSELAALIPPEGSLIVPQADPIVCPDGARANQLPSGHQMIYQGDKIEVDKSDTIERLTEADAPSMLALASLTKPGPFSGRTHILGEFWGIKKDGQLIAMAGERLKQPGFTEISAVCTHPDLQGHGLGRDLCITLMARILERDEIPYLHVFSNNTNAIRLYEKLGFRLRRELYVAELKRV